jgi:hypothetical protein
VSDSALTEVTTLTCAHFTLIGPIHTQTHSLLKEVALITVALYRRSTNSDRGQFPFALVLAIEVSLINMSFPPLTASNSSTSILPSTVASKMSFIVNVKPVSLLGRHRLLSPSAAVRVSPLALGAMNFGTAWKESLGECSKETAFEILDYFYEQGGNWIDTAVNYQFGESEEWIGEWMEARGVRDEMVVATKFTGMQITEREKQGSSAIKSNFAGNSAKNIHTSLDRSLKHLKTSYVDIVSRTPMSRCHG